MVAVLQDLFDADAMPEKGDEILDCIQAGMSKPETATGSTSPSKPCAGDWTECAGSSRGGSRPSG